MFVAQSKRKWLALNGAFSALVFISCGLTLAVYGDDQPDWQLNDREARALYKKGDLVGAQEKWKAALKQADSQHLVEPGIVNCLCALALIADKQAKPAESERLYELAMRSMEGLVGPSDPRFAEWMPDLALLYEAHGKADQAEVLYKRALTIDENSLGKNDMEVAEVLDKYAKFLRRQNRQPEAMEIEERARFIRVKVAP